MNGYRRRIGYLVAAVLVAATLGSSCQFGASVQGSGSAFGGSQGATTSDKNASAGQSADAEASQSADAEVNQISVPKLVGKFYFHAKRVLESSGLAYGSETVVKGGNGRRVKSQEPAAGTQVPEGYQVAIVLAEPPPEGGRKIESLAAATSGLTAASDSGSEATSVATSSVGETTTSSSGEDGGSTSSGSSSSTTKSTSKSSGSTTKKKSKPKSAKISMVDSEWGPVIENPIINFSVKNTGSATAYCVKVTGKVYDSGGALIGTATDVAAPIKMKVGQTSYGRLSFGSLPSTGTVKYAYEWNTSSSGCKAFDLTVESKSLTTLPTGRVAATGVVKNSTKSTPFFTYAMAVAFNSSGDIVEVAMVELDPAFLYSGGSVPYLAEFDYTRSVSKYIVVAQGLTL